MKYFRHIRDTKACGYCHSNMHKGRLTVRMMRQHKCLQKQCHLFEKYPEHPYWVEKELIKAKKKAKKDANKNNSKDTLTDE